MSSLRTQELTKYGGRTVVKGVSLEVNSGEIVGLLGPNGAGKTTTFYMTVGLTAPTPAASSSMARTSPTTRPCGRGKGSASPGAVDLPRADRGAEHPRHPRDPALSAPERRQRARDLLAELGLSALAGSPAYVLSGGERRRAEITAPWSCRRGSCCSTSPSPASTRSRSPTSRRSFFTKERGIGVLITDHNVRETPITDRAYIVTDGAIFRDSTDRWPEDEEVRRIISGLISGWTRIQEVLAMAISQRLQTKLAQKLILTPSLQQAIKLLPMSTLELADLLTQEVVENPLLEEIPTEDLQAADAQPATEKEQEAPKAETKNDTWDDADYEYFFGEHSRTATGPRRRRKSASCRPSRTRCPRPAR